jgi:hypothetical protein
MKLAEALLRRKELQDKLLKIEHVKRSDIYELKVTRRKITEEVDDISASIPKLELHQVTKEYDHYSKQLRLIDAAIQQLNWTTDIEVNNSVWTDFSDGK